DDAIIQKILDILESDRIIVERWTKKGEREVDVRPGIVEINVSDKKNGFTMLLSLEKQKLAKPQEVLKLIFGDNLPDDITRTEQYADFNVSTTLERTGYAAFSDIGSIPVNEPSSLNT
ncbi:unnamed protein product, partial [marine sediment metagenome]